MDKGWRTRAEGAQARQVERQERERDPQFQAMRATRAAILQAREDAMEATSALAREEQEGPVRAVVAMLADKFGDDLPAFAAAVRKAGGLSKVATFLEKVLARDARARRSAAVAA